MTYSSKASATVAGGGGMSTHASAEYVIQDTVRYGWSGTGTPTQSFYVNVNSIKATASSNDDGAIVGDAQGYASTNPASATASVGASQSDNAPPASTPASVNYLFETNGSSSPSWTVTAGSDVGTSVLYGTEVGKVTATSTITLNAPSTH